MTSMLEGADNLVARGTEVGVRVRGLDAAVTAARGRLDGARLEAAEAVVRRASDRLRLSADHTVVALGGATGSGKSSTFNALVGLELASVGVRRPTTSWATACTWGSNGAGELLDWLGIPPRYQTVRDSMLDTGREPNDLNGLVLLDLPDHDSTEVSHHLEVDRLVRLADLLVWVLDPQKYADAAVHDRFLRPLAAHKDTMVIVLNHIDEVAEDRRAGMVADLRRLLDADGLYGVTLIPVSAIEGIGIEELRRTISQRVADKAATRARISTNLTEVTTSLAAANGEVTPPTLSDRDRTRLRDAVADAAGVPVVTDAVRRASLARTRRATGWPVVSWMSRLRRDPLRHLNLQASDRELVSAVRSSIPDAHQVQAAQVDSAVRELADQLSVGLTRPWASAITRAATTGLPELTSRLDRAVGGTELGVGRIAIWARMVNALQWLLLLTAVVGAGWLGGLSGSNRLKLKKPMIGSFSLPEILLAGGLVLGLLLALGCRALVRRTAARRASRADERLRAAVTEVTHALVIVPISIELDAYRAVVEGLRIARA
ncbi:MAG: tRNA modification GTPase TrmE [Marmoricola sp.]|nr:tRNA modification GTPase TrmE [Marmoricola sp.]